MLEINRIREEKDQIVEALKVRNIDAEDILNEILTIDTDWRNAKGELEGIAAEANKIAKEIGQLFAQGKQDEANAAKEKTQALKDKEKDLKAKVAELDEALQAKLYELPNVPNKLVPAGNSESDNQEISAGGEMPKLAEAAKPHWDLAKEYNLIDFELGVKVSGAGFPFYLGQGARLQRALINFFLDEARDVGFMEVIPPFVVNEASGYGTSEPNSDRSYG